MPTKFKSKNAVDFDINRTRCSNRKLFQALQQNQASYQLRCEKNYNNCMFERELQEEMKQKRLRKTMVLKVHYANEHLFLRI